MAAVLPAALLAGALADAPFAGVALLAAALTLASVFLLLTAAFFSTGFDETTVLALGLPLALLLVVGAVALTGFLATGLAAEFDFAPDLATALLAGFLAAAAFGLTTTDFLAGLLAAALTGLAGFLLAAEAARVLATLALSLVADFFTVFLLVAMDRSTLGS